MEVNSFRAFLHKVREKIKNEKEVNSVGGKMPLSKMKEDFVYALGVFLAVGAALGLVMGYIDRETAFIIAVIGILLIIVRG